MFNRRQLIEYACPECGAELGAAPEQAGSNHHCRHCDTDFTIPLGRVPKLVTVSDTPAMALLPQEEAEVRRNLPARKPRPQRRQVIVPEVVNDDFDGERETLPRRHAHVDDEKRVKLVFGEHAQMELDVDKPTRNAMAMGFLGAVMTLLGVVVAAMFGIKKRS